MSKIWCAKKAISWKGSKGVSFSASYGRWWRWSWWWYSPSCTVSPSSPPMQLPHPTNTFGNPVYKLGGIGCGTYVLKWQIGRSSFAFRNDFSTWIIGFRCSPKVQSLEAPQIALCRSLLGHFLFHQSPSKGGPASSEIQLSWYHKPHVFSLLIYCCSSGAPLLF